MLYVYVCVTSTEPCHSCLPCLSPVLCVCWDGDLCARMTLMAQRSDVENKALVALGVEEVRPLADLSDEQGVLKF